MVDFRPFVPRAVGSRDVQPGTRRHTKRGFAWLAIISLVAIAALYTTTTLLNSRATIKQPALIHYIETIQTRFGDVKSIEQAPTLNLAREVYKGEEPHELLNEREIQTETGGQSGSNKHSIRAAKRHVNTIGKTTEETSALVNQTQASVMHHNHHHPHHHKGCSFFAGFFWWLNCHSFELNNNTRVEKSDLLGFTPLFHKITGRSPDTADSSSSNLQQTSCEDQGSTVSPRCGRSYVLNWFQISLITAGGAVFVLIFVLVLLLSFARRRIGAPRSDRLFSRSDPSIATSPHLRRPENATMGSRRVNDLEAQRDGITDTSSSVNLDGCSDAWRQWLEYKRMRELRVANRKSRRTLPRRQESAPRIPSLKLPKAVLRF